MVSSFTVFCSVHGHQGVLVVLGHPCDHVVVQTAATSRKSREGRERGFTLVYPYELSHKLFLEPSIPFHEDSSSGTAVNTACSFALGSLSYMRSSKWL